MKTAFGFSIAATMVAGVSSVAFAGDPVIYDNGAPDWTPGGGSPASQLELAYPFDAGAADDFMLGHSGVGDGSWNISEVHWFGSYFNGAFISPDSFNIIIWGDVGGMPGGGGQGDGSLDYSQALATYNIAGDNNQTLVDSDNGFSYSAVLTTAFNAAADTSYWIEIQPVFLFPPQWAFQRTAANVNGGQAHQGFPLLGLAFWTPTAQAFDLSFSLKGEAVPAPGALALLGLAGLSGMRRRRRK